MRLSILVDNNTTIEKCFTGEPAFSCHLEDSGTRILFDVGYSDAFMRNAQRLQINLLDLDYLAFSHGHYDHMWGLDGLLKMYTEASLAGIPASSPQVIVHPRTFLDRPRQWLGGSGSLIKEDRLAYYFKITKSTEPVWLTKRLVWLGEIERTNDFECQKPYKTVRVDGQDVADFMLDDTALVFKAAKGLVVISACSHSGICNIIEFAKKVCGDNRILDVIGGFHLLDTDPAILEKTVSYFSSLKPLTMHPCHCTDFKAKKAIAQVTDIQEVGSGLQLDFD
jgi:7,8-dihydropterin-6-yl-methyl-4-(beta-D-ribofuranosyl)aminobenzene 5'-phosphate synthase